VNVRAPNVVSAILVTSLANNIRERYLQLYTDQHNADIKNLASTFDAP